MESGGVSQPLFMVTGSCLGQEIQLDTDHVPFGAVWQGSQSSRRILIINSGDIGARWVLTYVYYTLDDQLCNLFTTASSGKLRSLLQTFQYLLLRVTSHQEWRYMYIVYVYHCM